MKTIGDMYYASMFMPDLERLARLGDERAQEEVERRSRKFATNSTHTCLREALTKDEFMKETV